MKKIINRIKKVFIIIGTFCFSILCTKVFASTLYGNVQISDLNPIYKPKTNEITKEIPMIWKIARGFIIPLAFIIGIIIYFKKSSSSKAKKIITIFVALIIVILLCLGINYFITR